MRITYVCSDALDIWNSVEWRCLAPARAINRTGRHTAHIIPVDEFSHNSHKARSVCARSNILLIHRNLWGNVLPIIQHWKANGKTVIVDFEGAYGLLTERDPEYPFWVEGKVSGQRQITDPIYPPPLTQFKWGMQLVNGATVSSKRLVDDWKNYNPAIEYVSSYIDLEKYAKISPKPHDGVIIGWRGKESEIYHLVESGCLDALREIFKLKRNIKLMFSCDVPQTIEKLDIPEERVILFPWTRGSSWPGPLSYIDIGIAPLTGEYSQRSSLANIHEFLVTKIPWVASQSSAYHEVRPHGWLVENKAGAWQRILLDMIGHIEDYKEEAAHEPYLYGLSQGIDENVQKIIDAYARIGSGQSEWTPEYACNIQKINSPA